LKEAALFAADAMGYGISIDFGLEVVEKQSVCGAIFESELIELTNKLKLTIASS
jgi:hypothetical protein